MPEPEADRKPPVLLVLAAEGVLPVLAGCAGAVAGGPVGGVAGVAVGHAVERAINLFGRGIVARWQAWFAAHPDEAKAAVAELAAAPPAEVRAEAQSIFLELAPDAAPEDVERAIEFLTAIPPAVDRALVPDAAGTRSVPATVLWDDARSLLQLLPEDVPPYPAETPLSGTPYRLRELLGAGGFGAVYRAESPSLQHLPLAIKFCLDQSLLPALHRERSNLERLMRAGGRGSAHVVRLYGYDLDHATPYLVYEYVDGGDLTKLLAARVAALGRAPGAAEVFGWVLQIAEGLAFAHAAGLVHRDLKPANVLVTADGQLRLADFGIGGIAAAAAAVRSRIGASTIDFLSLADQASLFRGAGTPLYMSPEQRRGAAPDPRHDLYALGVMWFQLLVGDVSRELPHGWAKELTVRYGVPPEHVALIERCVGWMDERPKDAGELLPLLRAAVGSVGTPVEPPPLPASEQVAHPTPALAAQVTPSPLTEGRRRGLSAALARLTHAYDELNDMTKWTFRSTALWGLLVGAAAALISFLIAGSRNPGEGLGIGAFFGLVVWALFVWLIRLGVNAVAADLQKKAEATADEVANDFPVEVADLGGRLALRHPATVRRLRAELDPPPVAPVAATATLTAADLAADPTRKALLLARLTELQTVRTEVSDAKDLITWVWLPCGVLVSGGAVGGLVFAFFREGLHINDAPAALMALLAVAGVIGLVWRLTTGARREHDRRWKALAARFEADYARLVAAWGGSAVLQSQETVAALIRVIDPDAGRKPAGIFRRIMGG